MTGKQTEGRSELYVDDLRYRLDDFAKAFNVEVRQLTPADVQDFMRRAKASARGASTTIGGHCGRSFVSVRPGVAFAGSGIARRCRQAEGILGGHRGIHR